jgi:hypothetical protein
MGAISSERIAGHTPERWAKDLERAVAGMLALETHRPAR